MKTEPYIKHQTEDLDDIIRYYAKDFDPGRGKKIERYTYLIDPVMRKVVFEFVLKDKQ